MLGTLEYTTGQKLQRVADIADQRTREGLHVAPGFEVDVVEDLEGDDGRGEHECDAAVVGVAVAGWKEKRRDVS